ncbi:hypothetical protein AVEN_137408-1 [Araneus ventricosus]|uniref:Transposase Tc1-like domain-containing protein n=1 Tax=Araneus ventricosus TaxID=182803 RepID=A0A4Y2KHT1_ARAVE|nr:hypothetical protein AVEN_137408-1 [Araneus ventricosus]
MKISTPPHIISTPFELDSPSTNSTEIFTVFAAYPTPVKIKSKLLQLSCSQDKQSVIITYNIYTKTITKIRDIQIQKERRVVLGSRITIGENVQKFSGSRVTRTTEIGRLPIRNLLNIHIREDLAVVNGASRRPGSGRPRGTTEREDRSLGHRTASAAEIRAAVGTTVTQRTVTYRLLQGQLRARHPVACILPTPNHCRLRREWCQARTEWRSVAFSDESRFYLGASDGRVLVRRRPGERLQPTCLRPRHTGLCIQNFGGCTGY